jgi:hypothetical protein
LSSHFPLLTWYQTRVTFPLPPAAAAATFLPSPLGCRRQLLLTAGDPTTLSCPTRRSRPRSLPRPGVRASCCIVRDPTPHVQESSPRSLCGARIRLAQVPSACSIRLRRALLHGTPPPVAWPPPLTSIFRPHRHLLLCVETVSTGRPMLLLYKAAQLLLYRPSGPTALADPLRWLSCSRTGRPNPSEARSQPNSGIAA